MPGGGRLAMLGQRSRTSERPSSRAGRGGRIVRMCGTFNVIVSGSGKSVKVQDGVGGGVCVQFVVTPSSR